MFDRPILIYSNYCNYSKLFVEHLTKFPPLFEAFIRVNIDPVDSTKQRPKVFYEIQEILKFKISEVPTIIVQNGEFVLSGKEAFSWLEYQLNQIAESHQNESSHQQNNPSQQQDNVLEPFNPLEMGSFSDGYAGIGDDAPSMQSFQFLNAPIQNIQTPEETGDNYEKQNNSHETRGNDYSNYLQERNTNMGSKALQSSDKRMMSQFSNNTDKTNRKQNEVDKKYEQLLAERDGMFEKRNPKRVNFADGSYE